VVVTSSSSAIMPSPGWPAGEVRDERCWTDIDYCEKNGVSLSLLQAAVLPTYCSVSRYHGAMNDGTISLGNSVNT
jgi:hypothetical protein